MPKNQEPWSSSKTPEPNDVGFGTCTCGRAIRPRLRPSAQAGVFEKVFSCGIRNHPSHADVWRYDSKGVIIE